MFSYFPRIITSALSTSAAFSSTQKYVLLQTSRHFTTGTTVGAPLRKKVTTLDLQKMRDKGKPITMVTAYTYPSAMHVEQAGIDVLLVGDSLAMVELGYDTTLPVTIDEMLYHCKAVARGAQSPLLVGDMPFGSYQRSIDDAYYNATRFLKEGNMDCVKVEGGKIYANTVRALVNGGVAVMGHVGLTPQNISVLGGFRAQGKTIQAAKKLVDDARALQAAGAFSLVIECVPSVVADIITRSVDIPTIGIGAGAYTSGQVLVYHDLLGMLQHAHHAKVSPSFCKSYANIGIEIQRGLEAYKKEVEQRIFPGVQYSPYQVAKEEREHDGKDFETWLVSELKSEGITLRDKKDNHLPKEALQGVPKKPPQTVEAVSEQGQFVTQEQDQDGTIKVY